MKKFHRILSAEPKNRNGKFRFPFEKVNPTLWDPKGMKSLWRGGGRSPQSLCVCGMISAEPKTCGLRPLPASFFEEKEAKKLYNRKLRLPLEKVNPTLWDPKGMKSLWPGGGRSPQSLRVHGILSLIGAFSAMLVMILSSVALSVANLEYFHREYTEYSVYETIGIEKDDLLEITRETMDYLYGKRAALDMKTTVRGETREFYNANERLHMEDVRALFSSGLALRRACVLIFIVCVFLLWRTGGIRELFRGFIVAVPVTLGLIAVIAVLGAMDFNRYFTLFHRIFFSNDLWILDPRTDLLINMVPEGFFRDTVFRIGGIFLAMSAGVFAVSALCLRKKGQ